MGAYKKVEGSMISIMDCGVFNPSNLPKLDIGEGVINGSGVSKYKQVLKENYQSQNIIIDENEYALAGSIALIGSKMLDNSFNLKNAAPIYIRNKVAKTINERKIDL